MFDNNWFSRKSVVAVDADWWLVNLVKWGIHVRIIVHVYERVYKEQASHGLYRYIQHLLMLSNKRTNEN